MITRKFWCFYLVLIALLLGVVFVGGVLGAESFFLVTGIGAIIFTGVVTHGTSRDPLNPMSILIISASLRLGLPGVLLLWVDPNEHFGFFSVSPTAWSMGRAYALLGVLSVCIGWLMHNGSQRGLLYKTLLRSPLQLMPNVRIVAKVFFVLGGLLLAVWLAITYSDPLEAVQSGIIRDRSIRAEGASRYAILGTLFLYASCLLIQVGLMYQKRNVGRLSLLPGAIVAALMAPFGGRVGALSPLAWSLITYYYRIKERVGLVKFLMAAGALTLLLTVFSAAVLFFRGGGGLQHASTALTFEGFIGYLDFSIWNEIGMLHPYAIASVLGAGRLEGETYPLLGGYFSDFVGISGTVPGTFMVQKMSSSPLNMEWGIHTGIFVDVFLNSGLFPALLSCALLGYLMHGAYSLSMKFYDRPVVGIAYPVFLWNFLWIFYESITFISLTVNLMLVLFAIFLVGRLTVSRRQGANALDRPRVL